MRETITLNDFSYSELSSNPGLKLKMEKIFRDFLHKKLAYFEVVYVDSMKEQIFVYAIDTQWYSYCLKLDAPEFSKKISLKLGVVIAIANLPDVIDDMPKNNKSFLQIIKEKELEARGIYLSADKVESFNLDSIEESSTDDPSGIQSPYKTVLKELTLQMQMLVISNDYLLEKPISSKFDINLMSFRYNELHDMLLPVIKELVPSTSYIRITERTAFTLKVLVVTSAAKLYQFTYSISDRFSQLFSRYLNYLFFDERVSDLKKCMKDYVSNLSLAGVDDSMKGILAAIRTMTFNGETLRVCPLNLAAFLFKHTSARETSGDENGQLKNVNQFYADLTDDENEMKIMIVKQFMAAKTFEAREIKAREKEDFEKKLKFFND